MHEHNEDDVLCTLLSRNSASARERVRVVEDDVLCTLLSRNSASARERVRVVAGCAIDHVKHQFLGFDVTKSLLLMSCLNM